jgi:hypothetical protein
MKFRPSGGLLVSGSGYPQLAQVLPQLANVVPNAFLVSLLAVAYVCRSDVRVELMLMGCRGGATGCGDTSGRL